MFRVYQNGRRCSDYAIKGWDTDTFSTKRKAEVFAVLWAYPVSQSQAEAMATPMDLGVEYDYSQCESPVLMSIREV